MRFLSRFSGARLVALAATIVLCGIACTKNNKPQADESHQLKPRKTVSGLMQARPGGPLEQVEVEVHEVPVDLPTVPADQANLENDELVIGVVQDGEAVAYPIRYVANYEVLDSKVGKTPVAPTW